MKNKKPVIILVAMVALQLFVLSVVVFNSLTIARQGTTVLVEVDGNNPYVEMGKSNVLFNCVGLDVMTPTIPEDGKLQSGDKIFVTYQVRENGYLALDKYYLKEKEVPETESYIEVRVTGIQKTTGEKRKAGATPQEQVQEITQYRIGIYVPFLKMHVSPVVMAELKNIKKPENAGKTETFYLSVKVRKGKTALQGVVVNGVPLERLQGVKEAEKNK